MGVAVSGAGMRLGMGTMYSLTLLNKSGTGAAGAAVGMRDGVVVKLPLLVLVLRLGPNGLMEALGATA